MVKDGRTPIRPRIYVLLAAVLWGTTGTAQAFAPEGAHPVAIGALRLGVGGLGLLAVAWLRGAFRGSAGWPARPVVAGAICMAAYQPLFFAGVANAGVAVGTIVAIGSAPVMAGMFGYVARGERLSWRWALATALALAGSGLLVGVRGDLTVEPTGVLLALGAGAAYAAYATAGKQLLSGDRAPEAVMAVLLTLGAVALAPLLWTVPLAWATSARGAGVVAFLGLVATSASYALFGCGLRHVSVATATTLTLAEPLTAALLGLVLLGERLAPPALAGAGLILAGLIVASMPGRRRRAP